MHGEQLDGSDWAVDREKINFGTTLAINAMLLNPFDGLKNEIPFVVTLEFRASAV